MTALGIGSTRHALKDRGDDLYETPPEATRALIEALDALGDPLPMTIWEPACGRGAVARVLEASGRVVVSTDLVDRGYGIGARDFLMERQRFTSIGAIVTNPPYKLASDFVGHALIHAPRVIMLLRLAFLEAGDPNGGPAQRARASALDGGSLARVFVFANRLPMMHRDGWDGPKAGSGVAYAWFEWRRGHEGPAALHRIRWRKG